MTICANWFSYGADSSAPKSSDFGLIVTCENPYESSERDRTIYSVPGRNGDIIIDNGRYANVSVTYTVNLLHVTPAKIDAIREWLLTPITYQRIYDSYDSTCYREGIFAGNIGWTLTQLQRHGSASITFNCKPQRWLVSGDTPLTYEIDSNAFNEFTITNPGTGNAYARFVFSDDIIAAFSSLNIALYDGDTVGVGDYYQYSGGDPGDGQGAHYSFSSLIYDSMTLENTAYIQYFSERRNVKYRIARHTDGPVVFGNDFPITPGEHAIRLNYSRSETLNNQTLTIYPRWWKI